MCDSLKCDKCNSISYTLYPIDDGLYVCKKCKDKIDNKEEIKYESTFRWWFIWKIDNIGEIFGITTDSLIELAVERLIKDIENINK